MEIFSGKAVDFTILPSSFYQIKKKKTTTKVFGERFISFSIAAPLQGAVFLKVVAWKCKQKKVGLLLREEPSYESKIFL